MLGCGGFNNTTRIKGTGSDRIEFQVVNDNWASATIRLVDVNGVSSKRRLGAVGGLSRVTFRLRKWYSGGFRLHVRFLANASPVWVDPMVYYGSEECIELMIKAYSQGSYSVLCYRN